MSNAHDLVPAPGDPNQIIDALFRLTRRLRDDLGVTIALGDVPDDKLCRYTDATRTLTVAPDLTAEEQLHAYTQAWFRLAIGPDAASDVTPVAPALSLVPPIPAEPVACVQFVPETSADRPTVAVTHRRYRAAVAAGRVAICESRVLLRHLLPVIGEG